MPLESRAHDFLSTLKDAEIGQRVFHAHEGMNALYTGLDAVLDDVARLAAVRGGSPG